MMDLLPSCVKPTWGGVYDWYNNLMTIRDGVVNQYVQKCGYSIFEWGLLVDIQENKWCSLEFGDENHRGGGFILELLWLVVETKASRNLWKQRESGVKLCHHGDEGDHEGLRSDGQMETCEMFLRRPMHHELSWGQAREYYGPIGKFIVCLL
jgi:hypothetical protein